MEGNLSLWWVSFYSLQLQKNVYVYVKLKSWGGGEGQGEANLQSHFIKDHEVHEVDFPKNNNL